MISSFVFNVQLDVKYKSLTFVFWVSRFSTFTITSSDLFNFSLSVSLAWEVYQEHERWFNSFQFFDSTLLPDAESFQVRSISNCIVHVFDRQQHIVKMNMMANTWVRLYNVPLTVFNWLFSLPHFTKCQSGWANFDSLNITLLSISLLEPSY